MKQILTIARRELQAFFLSPVAIIFLATFLLATLFTFFWVDTFFRRNIADIRPLFNWFPILLIFLVSALTMRLWSEEQRSGTIEILMTLPVKIHKLVLGKFLAGLGLIAIAIALTIALPLTVSSLGNPDWGPVVGGYIGTFLLAGAYLAIGLCISSTTDNAIVALILTCVTCGIFYIVGHDIITSLLGYRPAEILKAIGTGSRFESIQRGVLDLRDLIYYLSLCCGFLYLNTIILKSKRWSHGSQTGKRHTTMKLSAILVFANLLLFNLIITPIHSARVDLTERNIYSIAPVTKKLLTNLDEPLIIRGYFSAKTHPLLAPLIPQIRDIIKEYNAVGGSLVKTEFIDPQKNPAAEKEANEDYNIKSTPFRFADRHEDAIINSYFAILVKYGNKYQTLQFGDLIEVKGSGMKAPEVKLRNLEYDLTKTIKKVVHGFQPLESLFARVNGKVKLTAYLSPQTLPKDFKELPGLVQKVAEEIKKRSMGKFEYEQIDPVKNEELKEELLKKYGIKPFAVSLFSNKSFYLHFIVSNGDRIEHIYPSDNMNKESIREEVTASLKRLAPGFLKTVGIVSSEQAPPRMNPMMRQPPQSQSKLQVLKQKLSETYTVKDLKLKDGRVPGNVDVLAVIGLDKLDEKQKKAIDQYLMRGGSVIVCSGRYAMDPKSYAGLTVKKNKAPINALLEKWGVKIDKGMVLDPQNEAFPVPVERNIGGLKVREMKLLNFPFWVDIRQNGMGDDLPVVSGLPSVTLQWVSPLKLYEDLIKKHKLKSTVILRSTKDSWIQDHSNIQPNFAKYPKLGFAPEGKTQSRTLAVSLTGTFPSAFAEKNKTKTNDKNKPGQDKDRKKTKNVNRLIMQSPETARLIVVGSSDFVNDLVIRLAGQTNTDKITNNLQFVQNMVDWSLADVDLLTIRSRGTFARTLNPTKVKEHAATWEIFNYAFVILALFGIVGISYFRRRNIQPISIIAKNKKGMEASS